MVHRTLFYLFLILDQSFGIELVDFVFSEFELELVDSVKHINQYYKIIIMIIIITESYTVNYLIEGGALKQNNPFSYSKINFCRIIIYILSQLGHKDFFFLKY